MYTATFTFAPGQFDAEFHRLDAAIAAAARAIPGYLFEEAWENPSTGVISNVYYWNSLEAIETLMCHPLHLEAKARQARWLDGFRVVISQVLRSYGDGKLAFPDATLPAAP